MAAAFARAPIPGRPARRPVNKAAGLVAFQRQGRAKLISFSYAGYESWREINSSK